jgi:hypothetical protein
MNINRYNYEEYLMLYIDSELSPSEKQEVESFLQQNPDVKEELELLQQAVLQPEHIVFEAKRSLYKKDSGISLTNYQDYFLLYIDNELSLLQKEALETFVLQHPQLQDEFTLLKQTVLPEEILVFANKEILYRKEEKRRPVIISFNYRWASLAAAVMIGVVALVWIFNTGNSASTTNERNPTAVKTIEPKINTSNGTDQTQPAQTLHSSTNNEQPLAVEENKKQENIVTKENVAPFKQTPTQENIAAVQNNIQQKEQQQTVAGTTGNNEVRSNTNITLPTDNVSVSADDPYTSVAATPSTTNDNHYTVKPTANEELNTDENDKSLLVGSMQINKDKLRGFFRKAGRLFSNKVKPEDGKLQIANMEINSLK